MLFKNTVTKNAIRRRSAGNGLNMSVRKAHKTMYGRQMKLKYFFAYYINDCVYI